MVRQFLVEAMVLTGSAGVAAVLFCLGLIALLNLVPVSYTHLMCIRDRVCAEGQAVALGSAVAATGRGDELLSLIHI